MLPASRATSPRRTSSLVEAHDSRVTIDSRAARRAWRRMFAFSWRGSRPSRPAARGPHAPLAGADGESAMQYTYAVRAALGQLTRAMARAVAPSGRVLGIERSAQQIAEARRLARADGEEHLLELRAGDVMALDLAPDEWGSFDVAHARFILEHVPDPQRVVRAMVRAVRVGGRVVLEDDDHDVLRLWPEPAGLYDLWRAYIRGYERNGNDPYAGRRLVALPHVASAAPARNEWLYFGGCAGDGRLGLFVRNLVELLEGARSEILAAGELDGARFEA